MIVAAAIAAPLAFSSAAASADQATARTAVASPDVRLGSGQVVSTDPVSRTKDEETSYRDEITRLEVTGQLDAENMKRMGLTLLSAPTPAAVAPSPAPTGAANGTAGAPAVEQACSITDSKTSASAMSLPAPKITVNSSSQGYIMYAKSTFQWSSPPAAPSTCRVNVGGADGFAFSFNKAVTNLGTSFLACNALNKCGSYGWLETNSQYGSGYAFQDKAGAITTGYSDAYKGTITHAFRTSTTSCTQAFAKYAHTWSSTSVNGFSIGPWSIGVQWSSTTSQWQKSSLAGSYSC